MPRYLRVVGVCCCFLLEISTEAVRSFLIGVERRVGWKIRATKEIVEMLNFCLLLPTRNIYWCWIHWATNSCYREI